MLSLSKHAPPPFDKIRVTDEKQSFFHTHSIPISAIPSTISPPASRR